MYKLYIYDHCPYCTRARMIFGYKDINVDIRYLLNDDEDAHIEKIGKKIVPILQKEDGSYMAESLDIVKYIDEKHGDIAFADTVNPEIEKWLNDARDVCNKLAMPRWAVSQLEEFATPSARLYFLKKKEAYIGDFSKHLENTESLKEQAQQLFKALEKHIESPDGVRGKPSIDDIYLFPVLRSFTFVKNIQLPDYIEAYLRRQSFLTGIWLFDGFAL